MSAILAPGAAAGRMALRQFVQRRVLSWKLPARVEVNLRITAYLCNSAGDVEHGHRAGANADGRAAGGNGIRSNGANRDSVRKRATLMLSSSADALLFDL